MIIHQLKAENLFRFTSLQVTELPTRGVIGISGPNESGKSAIVELLCLALFGRTYALPAERLAKAVKWGCTTGSVEVVFTARDGQTYTVTRHLEVDGRQRAGLHLPLAGTSLARGVAAVNYALRELLGYGYQEYVDALYFPQRGADQGGGTHDATIKSLAGVAPLESTAATLREEARQEQDRLVDILLLSEELRAGRESLDVQPGLLGDLQGQRDRTRGQATEAREEGEQWSAFEEGLKTASARVLGEVGQLAACGASTTAETWRVRADRLGEALTTLGDSCRGSGVEVEVIPGEGLRRWQSDLVGRLGQLEELMEKVSQHRAFLLEWLEGGSPEGDHSTLSRERGVLSQERSQLQRRRGSNRTLAVVLFLLALLLGGSWGVFQFLPDSPPARFLEPLLTTRVLPLLAPATVTLPQLLMALAGIGGGLGVLGFLFWVRSLGVGKALRQLRARETRVDQRAQGDMGMVESMSAAVGQPLVQAHATLKALESAPWAGDLRAWGEEKGRMLLEEGERTAQLRKLGELGSAMQREVEELIAEAREAAAEARTRLLQAEGELTRLEEEIGVEEGRRAEDDRLSGRLRELAGEEQARRRQIRVREAGRELLLGAARPLSQRFNQELRRFLTDLVPRLTNGRYQQMRISDDLEVEAFSVEKEDFVELDEISTGAQQQIMLAVRLALAQALESRTGQGPQMVVLDEAFAYYDRTRMLNALHEVRDNSGTLSQLWVAAQELDPDQEYAVRVECRSDQDRLTVAAG